MADETMIPGKRSCEQLQVAAFAGVGPLVMTGWERAESLSHKHWFRWWNSPDRPETFCGRPVVIVPAHEETMVTHSTMVSQIDAAVAAARRAAERELSSLRRKADAIEAENADLLNSLLNVTGDNSCWLPEGVDIGPIPPWAEFQDSCRRHHTQISTEHGVLEGCKTIAQLEQENARLRAGMYTLYPAAAWTEEDSTVLWWHLPVSEPPYVGAHECMGEHQVWGPTTCAMRQRDGWLTHWSRIPDPRKMIALDGSEVKP